MTKEQTYINESSNLDQLLDRILEIQLFEGLSLKIFGRIDDPVSWGNLPTFGGDKPTCNAHWRILSWDDNRVMVSTPSTPVGLTPVCIVHRADCSTTDGMTAPHDPGIWTLRDRISDEFRIGFDDLDDDLKDQGDLYD